MHYNPHTGALLGEVLFPTAQVTSLAFGGADLDELYVTTGREDVPATDRCKLRHAFSGQLFRVKGLGIKGLPSQVCARALVACIVAVAVALCRGGVYIRTARLLSCAGVHARPSGVEGQAGGSAQDASRHCRGGVHRVTSRR